MLGGKLKTDIGYIYIIVVYRLHRSNVDDFREEISKLVESLDGPCLVMGDFNHNCFTYNSEVLENDDIVEKYISMFMSKGFSPLISRGTRFDNKNNNTVTCIDQI